MKAYIVHNSPLGTEYWGEGMYALITEKEQVIFERWCTNRAFANHDLTIGVQTMLQDNDITEVYSNGVVVWSDGKISKDADADFRSANYEYERVNSDARKARVKATGEIVEVEFTERKTHTDEEVYITQEGCLIEESRLDFNVETIDYWTRLEHQYAGMAMQGILGSEEIMMRINKMPIKGDKFGLVIAELSTNIALALIQKLKEKEERK